MKIVRSLALATLLAASANAFAAKTCKVEITGNDAMQYDKKEISVAADCTDVEVTLKHAGKLPAQAMGHNFVLSKTADMAGIAGDGAGAGFANDHI
jgi:azurin